MEASIMPKFVTLHDLHMVLSLPGRPSTLSHIDIQYSIPTISIEDEIISIEENTTHEIHNFFQKHGLTPNSDRMCLYNLDNDEFQIVCKAVSTMPHLKYIYLHKNSYAHGNITNPTQLFKSLKDSNIQEIHLENIITHDEDMDALINAKEMGMTTILKIVVKNPNKVKFIV
jgi:hypothetical protein